jgi:uncharacterized protein with von Willebrand factor type A (vWA) domain
MDRTLANFIRALRNSEVRISTAETLDAFNAVELCGYEDRDFLKRSLSLVLPKTIDEKETFDACFDQFFSFKDVSFRSRMSPGNAAAQAKTVSPLRVKTAKAVKVKVVAPAENRVIVRLRLQPPAARRKRRKAKARTA